MRNKVFSVLCAVLATVVMGGALVYYNFIDKKKVLQGVSIGDVCPDFTVDMMVANEGTFSFAEEKYTLSEHNGKVRVINFWATWCGGCIEELPHFNEFAVAYPEVEVIAICGECGPQNTVQKWMNNETMDAQKGDWDEYSLTFGFYGPERSLYGELGGMQALPMTVVVDENGVIRYTKEAKLNFEQLENIVLPLLND